MPTISSVADVRAEGALEATSATGAVTDNQITAGITAAYQTMLREFGLTLYEEVRQYAGGDTALVERKDRFKHAEASFAIGELATILDNKQLVESGLARQKRIGDATIDLASPEEV